MKKKIIALSLLTIAGFLTGCKNEKTLVEQSAIGYLTAMGNYRISEAEQFATQETIEKTLHEIERYIMPNLDSNVIKLNTPATIEITGVTITDDTLAEVSYIKNTPSSSQEGTLNMVKRGEWKAQVKIQIPEALKMQHKADAKALDQKYKGKLKTGKPGEAPPIRNSFEKER